MKPADKAYIERGREHNPDPAEEVFASVKALIALLTTVAFVVLVVLAWLGKL